MLMRVVEINENKKESPATLILIDNIFEQCISYLE